MQVRVNVVRACSVDTRGAGDQRDIALTCSRGTAAGVVSTGSGSERARHPGPGTPDDVGSDTRRAPSRGSGATHLRSGGGRHSRSRLHASGRHRQLASRARRQTTLEIHHHRHGVGVRAGADVLPWWNPAIDRDGDVLFVRRFDVDVCPGAGAEVAPHGRASRVQEKIVGQLFGALSQLTRQEGDALSLRDRDQHVFAPPLHRYDTVPVESTGAAENTL